MGLPRRADELVLSVVEGSGLLAMTTVPIDFQSIVPYINGNQAKVAEFGRRARLRI